MLPRVGISYSLATIVGIQLIGPSALAQQPDTMPAPADRMSTSAQSFATQAATIGQAEIELGKLALQNSNDAGVQQYAQTMVKDHTAADARLKAIAAKENLTLPQSLDAEHKAVKQKLSALKGAEFDSAYSAEMTKGHDKAVALFESASQTATLPADLKQFAVATLPTLRKHKEMAHSLQNKEGV